MYLCQDLIPLWSIPKFTVSRTLGLVSFWISSNFEHIQTNVKVDEWRFFFFFWQNYGLKLT